MGWEKSKIGDEVLFTYSDRALCRDCIGYENCPKYKDHGACEVMEIWKGGSFLNIRLYDTQRTSLCAVSCVELNCSKKKSKDVWKLAEDVEKIPEIKAFEENGVVESKRFASGLVETVKEGKIPKEIQRFQLVFQKGGTKIVDYEFLYPQSFLMLLKKLPIVENSHHPTATDLDFPFKTVEKREFPDAYKSLYNQLVDFANKNARTCEV